MANAELQRRIHRIVRRSGIRPHRVLEVGGYVNEKSLLRAKIFRHSDRWCINLVDQAEGAGIRHVVGSANDMHMFRSRSFDMVLSCAVHEHDARFWESVAEMKRVLRPGGLLVVCVPGFVAHAGDKGPATTTFRVHTAHDYYRFSRRAVREMFLGGFDGVQIRTALEPPRIIGWGTKPLKPGDRTRQVIRHNAGRARRLTSRLRASFRR